MFKKLFGIGKTRTEKDQGTDLYEPRMPEVDEPTSIEEIFAQARKASAGEITPPGNGAGRHVVLVTPGRILMFQPCPPPGSMPSSQVDSIEKMISSKTKRNIAVIAFTELKAVTADISRAIPFMGLLMGFAYIGHSVWVFEGHISALAAGCRDAHLLLVDGGMVSYLSKDWAAIASSFMRHKEIYVHDRKTFSLRKIDHTL